MEGQTRELVRQEALDSLIRVRREIEICGQKPLMGWEAEDSSEMRAFDDAYERLLLLETAREGFAVGFRAGLNES